MYRIVDVRYSRNVNSCGEDVSFNTIEAARCFIYDILGSDFNRFVPVRNVTTSRQMFPESKCPFDFS